jgi:hypothetical protein
MYVWGWINNKLSAMKNQPQNLAELEMVLTEFWEQVTLESIRNLYIGMPNRIEELRKVRGYNTSVIYPRTFLNSFLFFFIFIIDSHPGIEHGLYIPLPFEVVHNDCQRKNQQCSTIMFFPLDEIKQMYKIFTEIFYDGPRKN